MTKLAAVVPDVSRPLPTGADADCGARCTPLLLSALPLRCISYDTFCPISSVIPLSSIPHPQNVELWLKVNGALRQKGNTNDQIFTLPTLIAHISTIFTLEEGDLILTGTPEVGQQRADADSRAAVAAGQSHACDRAHGQRAQGGRGWDGRRRHGPLLTRGRLCVATR